MIMAKRDWSSGSRCITGQALEKVLLAPRWPIALAGGAVVLAMAGRALFPDHFPAAVQRRLDHARPAPQSGGDAVRVGAHCHLGRSSPARPAGNRTHRRRTGRAELDEHAEGVHVTELEIRLKPGGRPKEAIYADIRQRLKDLPASLSLGQPIAHRLDHMLSGVRAQIAIKLFGEDLDTLRAQAGLLRERLAKIPGMADLEIEKQVLAPQIKVRVDFEAAARYGISTAQLTRTLQTLVDGEKVTQIVEGNRRFDLVVRLPESARSLEGLKNLLVETPGGRIPLSKLASIEDADGPNQITRDEGRRRIVISANAQGRALSEVVAELRAGGRRLPLAGGLFHHPRRPVPGAGRGGQADFAARAWVDRADLHGVVQPLSVGAAGRADHGQRATGAGWQRARPVAVRPAAVGCGADRLHHAGRHCDAQRHPESQPLPQPDALRR
jgi:HME family heavy-metal exporter